MSRSPLIPALALLMLAGCDRAAEAPAQPVAGDAAAAPATDTVDRRFAGTAIPALQLADPAGKVLDLGAQDGPVLLNLWATWCAPCVAEMPQLDALAGALEGEVRVITVSQDIRGGEVVVPFFAKGGYTRLEPWLDPDTQLSAQFTPEGVLPLTILFDASGKEVLRVAGAYDWGAPEAEALIRDALKAS
ncbi:TlpA family protein disulfide reductase [Erythrobacter sp. BLCC-B19]|uniref:TlpA family protein disulfide reductase n=1 Tax=Erythrobacter sp. BLCC-B19 TaxID=3025315 RepID=UPI0023620F43|nr:TlpA disulfide reductase family protein [Erythrobacter sp. BLCC-B19]WDA40009.1 TlpA disulfide reductase family protein [Erythrobacter sp. BLCC-B19]